MINVKGLVIQLSWEKKFPGALTLTLMFVPVALIAATFILTDYFSVNPTTYPPPFNSIVPLILLVVAIISAAISYITAKDEEPEWGPQLPFKIVEAIDIAIIVLSIMLIVLLITIYFI